MTIVCLVKTMWLIRHPWTTEVTYDQGSEFCGHGFKTILIKCKYGIKSKMETSGNNQATSIIEKPSGFSKHVWVYNLQETNKCDNYPWMGIHVATYVSICSMWHTIEGEIMVQVLNRYDYTNFKHSILEINTSTPKTKWILMTSAKTK